MIDPVAFKLGPLAVHWYGLSYGVGLMIGIWILITLNQKRPTFKNSEQIFDYAFWMFLLGVLVGGRLGYVLFYNLSYYLQHPADIFALWQGGMSFHGGLIGSFLVSFFFFRKHRIPFLSAADLIVIPGALALTFTRVANFINKELIGRVIENHFFDFMGVDFGDGILRYPSQLFQSGAALLQFLILLLIFSKKPKAGTLLITYFILEGGFRFLIEFLREPDPQVGYLFGFLTLGQLFSLALAAAGLAAMLRRQR